MNGDQSTVKIPLKKKRGRKPNITKNTKNITDIVVEECYIIKINNEKKNMDNFDINSFDINELNNDIIKSNIKSSTKCWNCCHDFIDIKVGLPLKYINNTFYIYGDFCSSECSLRYGYEYLNNKNIYDLYSNVHLYKKKSFKNNDIIKMAPSKLYLSIFGGDLSIEEYRESFIKNEFHNIELQPIIPINHIFENYEMNELQNKHNNLKLFRSKKLINEKKNIKNTMNLFNKPE